MIPSLMSQLSGKKDVILEKEHHIETLEKQHEEYRQANDDLITQNDLVNQQKTSLKSQHDEQIYSLQNQIHKLQVQVCTPYITTSTGVYALYKYIHKLQVQVCTPYITTSTGVYALYKYIHKLQVQVCTPYIATSTGVYALYKYIHKLQVQVCTPYINIYTNYKYRSVRLT